MKPTSKLSALSRREFMQLAGAGTLAAGAGSLPTLAGSGTAHAASSGSVALKGAQAENGSLIADPTNIPAPIDRTEAMTHDIELVAEERIAEVMPGVRHRFMTFNGQIPGPMIRVRVGDTVNLTLRNSEDSEDSHSVDLHAVYGSGGGAHYNEVAPGESKTFTFKATYPGGLIYHCGVDNADMHISRGMFGMILVEPEEGLPPVDREFYLGQHELYTDSTFGVPGDYEFHDRSMVREDPTYVLFNGAVAGFTDMALGPLKANVGETVRFFIVVGGPNLTSALHPIGNIWSRYWPQGALANAPLRYVSTVPVSPGSCLVGDMELPVPQSIRVLDHALSRAVHKGVAADLVVEGDERPDLLKAN